MVYKAGKRMKWQEALPTIENLLIVQTKAFSGNTSDLEHYISKQPQRMIDAMSEFFPSLFDSKDVKARTKAISNEAKRLKELIAVNILEGDFARVTELRVEGVHNLAKLYLGDSIYDIARAKSETYGKLFNEFQELMTPEFNTARLAMLEALKKELNLAMLVDY